MNETIQFLQTTTLKPELGINRQQLFQKLTAELINKNIQVFYLDGKEITNKQTFLKQAGESLKFPAYYGQNWDAFNDCITDLGWCPARAYILIYDQPEIFAKAEPEQWQIALTILNYAVEYWREKKHPNGYFLTQLKTSPTKIGLFHSWL